MWNPFKRKNKKLKELQDKKLMKENKLYVKQATIRPLLLPLKKLN